MPQLIILFSVFLKLTLSQRATDELTENIDFTIRPPIFGTGKLNRNKQKVDNFRKRQFQPELSRYVQLQKRLKIASDQLQTAQQRRLSLNLLPTKNRRNKAKLSRKFQSQKYQRFIFRTFSNKSNRPQKFRARKRNFSKRICDYFADERRLRFWQKKPRTLVSL